MSNKSHDFLITIKMDGKTIGTRNLSVENYNDNVIYSLRLHKLLTDMSNLVDEALRDKSIDESFRLLERGYFSQSSRD